MERKLKDYLFLALKGMAMGAADVVPGVSGGTIAFIVGIYDELINSIKSINAHSIKLLFTGKIAAFWKAINGNFLCSLLLGIGISVFSLAKLITYLLVHEPVLVWSFFFGLVLASTWFVSKDIKEWNWKTITGFVLGVLIAYYITVATPAETPTNLFFIHLCHDPAGYLRQFHSGASGQVFLYHGSDQYAGSGGSRRFCRRCFPRYYEFFTRIVLCSQELP